MSAIIGSNTLVRVSAVQSWIVSKNHTDVVVEALYVQRLSATDLVILLVIPSKPGFIVADTLPENKVEKPMVEESLGKQRCPSSATHLVAAVSQSIFNTDRLSAIRKSVRRMRVEVDFAETVGQ